MSYKITYKDREEETLEKAESWETDDEGFLRFIDEEEETICWIARDIIAKIE